MTLTKKKIVVKELPGFSTEAPDKPTKKKGRNSVLFAILGIYMALVFVSIAWVTYMLGMGTDWAKSTIIMLAPVASFGLFLLGYAFSKIFK